MKIWMSRFRRIGPWRLVRARCRKRAALEAMDSSMETAETATKARNCRRLRMLRRAWVARAARAVFVDAAAAADAAARPDVVEQWSAVKFAPSVALRRVTKCVQTIVPSLA